MKKKRLYRVRDGAMISGVCQGIGEYLAIDPTVIRVLWVIVSIFGTIGLGGTLIYLACTVIIPIKPMMQDKDNPTEFFESKEFRIKSEE